MKPKDCSNSLEHCWNFSTYNMKIRQSKVRLKAGALNKVHETIRLLDLMPVLKGNLRTKIEKLKKSHNKLEKCSLEKIVEIYRKLSIGKEEAVNDNMMFGNILNINSTSNRSQSIGKQLTGLMNLRRAKTMNRATNNTYQNDQTRQKICTIRLRESTIEARKKFQMKNNFDVTLKGISFKPSLKEKLLMKCGRIIKNPLKYIKKQQFRSSIWRKYTEVNPVEKWDSKIDGEIYFDDFL